MKIVPSDKIYLSESQIPNAGRGVFAKVNIRKGEVIEICPVIVTPEDQEDIIDATMFINFTFRWKGKEMAICLGFGSIYNHSYHPNAKFDTDVKQKLMTFTALKDIKKDEEITINYNFENPNLEAHKWLKSVKD